MRVKLATILTALVCVGGTFGAFSAMSPAIATANTNICEIECGGSWGAREHAEVYAERHNLRRPHIEGCKLNSEYGAQWVCWGYGTEPVLQEIFYFHVWIDAYGYEKHWTID